MFLRTLTACVFGAGLLAIFQLSANAADEKYEIKIRKATPGDKTQVTIDQKNEVQSNFTVAGMKQNKNEGDTAVYSYTREYVEGAPKAEKKVINVVVTKYEAKGKKEDSPELLNKKIVVTYTKGEAKFLVDGKEPTASQLAFLQKEFGKSKDDEEDEMAKLLFPPKPVAVGESWKVDSKVLSALMKEEKLNFNLEKSTMTGKLIKAYKKDDIQFGVIEIELNLVMDELPGVPNAKAKPGSKMKMTIVGDGCIDGKTSAGTMLMKIEGDFGGVIKAEGQEIDVNVRMKSEQKQVNELLQKGK
jgi:hypothetical protein